MAEKKVVTLVDDYDETEADAEAGIVVGPHEFAVDGVRYEIDLTEANDAKLLGPLRELAAKARNLGKLGKAPVTATGRATAASRASAPARSSGSGSTPVDREQNKAIREWARAQGYEVSERGRIPSNVTEEYHRQN